MAYPTNYRYTREHEWIELSGSIGSIGITDYAQKSLGDIVYVDLPKVGDAVTANTTFGSVESVKAVSDLFSPVTGTVTQINEELKSSPDKINEAPTKPGSSRSKSPIPHKSIPCSTRQPMRRLLRKNSEEVNGVKK